MHGNDWEWCEDWYGEKYPSGAVTDPTGPAKGELRVLRGGSWKYGYLCGPSANRYQCVPTLRRSDVGLRMALR